MSTIIFNYFLGNFLTRNKDTVEEFFHFLKNLAVLTTVFANPLTSGAFLPLFRGWYTNADPF